MTPREQWIMDSWDGGATIRKIAQALAVSDEYVRGIVCTYDFVQLGRHMARDELRTRAADRRYVAALIASGGTFA